MTNRQKAIDKPKGFKTPGDVLSRFNQDKDRFISKEFQKYGYELAKQLDDLKNKSLYIKLAKETPRGFLETAKNFVKDANNVKFPGRLFMWKLSKLKGSAKSSQKRS